MNLTEYAIKNKTISWMFVVLLIFGGYLGFNNLGRLEDPNFTIKEAIIITQYPGASAVEVEEEITLPIENALQQLPYVDSITSISSADLSQVQVEMKSIYRKDDLAQIWDEMRRKINDMQASLPPGSHPPIINDDFADVYGVFYAVTGEGYEYQELADYTDFLRRELVLVDGVGKVSIGGVLRELVYIEADRAKITASGVSVQTLQRTLQGQNLVYDGGTLDIGSETQRIETKFAGEKGLDALRKTLIGSVDGQLVYLGDIATINKGYEEPARHLYRFNGRPALTIGVSFAQGVNVVEVGKVIDRKLAELEYARPIGMSLEPIYNQPNQVEQSVQSFVVSLGQAVIIVILVLMLSMGVRPGIIMSVILLLTIAGTFIVMDIYDIELHRISLGALIIALGMLVDNAIVITEGIMISIQRGMSRLKAAIKIVSNTRWPLLGATVIAITAFAPIGLSPDASGEFTGSLFWVLFISLLISWILAITLTPFFCFLLFRDNKQQTEDHENNSAYQGRFYQLYRGLLHLTLRFRWPTMGLMVFLLFSAFVAFGNVRQAFFPDSSLPVFMVDYWLPQGTGIKATEQDIKQLEQDILTIEEVNQVTATIGQGAQRFMLTYAPERNYPSYAQLIVQANSFEEVAPAITKTQAILTEQYPQAFTRFKRVSIGPSTAAKIEARIIGPDASVLRRIGNQMVEMFNNNPNAVNVRQDWRERTKVITPVIDTAEARRLGINQADIERAIHGTVRGEVVGTYREGSKLLYVVARPPENERLGIDQIAQVQVFSPVSDSYINIGQFLLDTKIVWEDPLIKRLDRKRTLAVLADPGPQSNAFALFEELRPLAESLPMPQGYDLQWGGEYEAQQEANEAVFAFLPLGLLVMIVITIFMFNSIKQTLVIWITVPLAIIGVAYGLLVFNAPFSFTALLAVLSLIGMQIKNGIVLVEEIKRLNDEENKSWHDAISEASISRLRPVSMAALTTILGMIPLLGDAFFRPMAVTIMAGLGFATILTLIVVPVLFALFYRVKE